MYSSLQSNIASFRQFLHTYPQIGSLPASEQNNRHLPRCTSRSRLNRTNSRYCLASRLCRPHRLQGKQNREIMCLDFCPYSTRFSNLCNFACPSHILSRVAFSCDNNSVNITNFNCSLQCIKIFLIKAVVINIFKLLLMLMPTSNTKRTITDTFLVRSTNLKIH